MEWLSLPAKRMVVVDMCKLTIDRIPNLYRIERSEQRRDNDIINITPTQKTRHFGKPPA